jgi:hypothetical protein
VATTGELLAEGAHQAATARTAMWLDRLTDTGALTPGQRDQLAAEDGAASLTRILRATELARANPYRALRRAVTSSPLDGARSLTNVIYTRLREQPARPDSTAGASGDGATAVDKSRGSRRRFDPVGQRWADWVPQLEDPAWQRYLDQLAAAADERCAELGAATAADPPRWATDLLGPVPADGAGRAEWERKAGAVAGYRELTGRDEDRPAGEDGGEPTAGHGTGGPVSGSDVLGPAPGGGRVEAHAAFRTAWAALDLPEAQREELEMSDGQLRMRIRGYQRQQTWAPRYVGNELAGTRQAAEHHRGTAALHTAEADTTTDPDRAAELRQSAANAAALAATLDWEAVRLQHVDDARALWLAQSAGDRVACERATVELSRRHADDAEPEQTVTGEEWLAAHQQAVLDDEQHQPITEDDITDPITDPITDNDPAHTDHGDQDDRDGGRGDDADRDDADRDDADRDDADRDDADRERGRGRRPWWATHGAETDVADIRDIAAAEPRPRGEDQVRVPTHTETAGYVDGAERALAEIRAQQAYENAMEHDTWQARDADLDREDPYADTHDTGRDSYAEADT